MALSRQPGSSWSPFTVSCRFRSPRQTGRYSEHAARLQRFGAASVCCVASASFPSGRSASQPPPRALYNVTRLFDTAVVLYKALGGGWEADLPEGKDAEATQQTD